MSKFKAFLISFLVFIFIVVAGIVAIAALFTYFLVS